MSTRQATPGPSTAVILQTQQLNTKKRAISEAQCDSENGNNQKKVKRDEISGDAVLGSTKDKKKRRKRKRKMSVVVATAEPEIVRSRSRPRSVTAGTQPHTPVLASDTKPDANIEVPTAVNSLPIIDSVDNGDSTTLSADKGKGKAKEPRRESPPPTPSASIESPATQIARLTKELETQTQLLQKHQAQLSQVHQSLTCQICLDLLHKPFALSPCGHITCHGCLVRWFTAPATTNSTPQHPRSVPESHIHKRKTCPICRTVVAERPVEVWGVKSMVGSLVRSGLVELPVPVLDPSLDDAPTQGPNGNPDPWRNIFRPTRAPFDFHNFFHSPLHVNGNDGPRGDLEEMGMYDIEDGGIYRCIDCMHEIWDGICSGCEKVYPGHERDDDDDDDDGSSDDEDGGDLGRPRMGHRMLMDLLDMLGPVDHGDNDIDDDEEDDDDDDSDSVIDGGPSDIYVESEDSGDRAHRHAMLRRFGLHALGGLDPEPLMYGPLMRVPSEEEVGIARIDEEVVEEGYESSFIDDEALEDQLRGDIIDLDGSSSSEDDLVIRRPTRARASRVRRPDFIVASEGEDTDGDHEIEQVARRMGRGFRATRRANRGAIRGVGNRPIVIDSDEDGSLSSEVRVVGRSRRGIVVVNSDEEDHEGPRMQSYAMVSALDSDHDVGFQGRSEFYDERQSDSERDYDSEAERWSEHEREIYGEDDSIPGPSSRLRRLMDEFDNEESEEEW